jgi:transposase
VELNTPRKMPAAYSLDFRKKAVAAVKRGERKSEICRTLGISRNTLDLWLKREAETGSVAARTDFHRGAKPLIENLDEFRSFVEEYGHLTQKEMVKRWPSHVSLSSFARALRRIKFTRKKKLPASRTR